jgi:hypothetical protein
MKTNINILNINKHFKEENHKKINNNNYRNIIINHSYFIVNEANICHKIRKIPYFSNYFSILEDYEKLNVSQLNENTIEKIKEINEKQYYLFKYDDKNSIDFLDFIYNSTSIKKLIFDVINSFQHIIEALIILNDNNICYFEISPKKIIFLENYREKPVLSNFRFSLQLNKLNYNSFSNILYKINDFTYFPIEIHVLFYFIKDNIQTISYSFVEEFCEKFIENLNILRLFSKDYKITYKQQCIEMLKKYINMPKQQIIDDILERNNKWDIYGISILYLQIFGCIFRVFSLKESFVSKIVMELSKNIHPDSSKRMNLKETQIIFNKIFDNEKNWNFVNNLDDNKLSQLFDEFSK